jgi:hypothetical protein
MVLINNRTGAHHKVRAIPAGQIVAAITLLVLTVILALGAVAIGSQPAAASGTWPSRTAAMLAQDASHLRPYWDGRHPAVWTSPVDPMCVARFHGRHGWIRAGSHGPRWRAECLPDGPREYAWGIVP